MSASYPYLAIAKKYMLPYGAVLCIADARFACGTRQLGRVSHTNNRWSVWTKKAYDTLKKLYPHTYSVVLTEIDLANETEEQRRLPA